MHLKHKTKYVVYEINDVSTIYGIVHIYKIGLCKSMDSVSMATENAIYNIRKEKGTMSYIKS